MDREEIITFLMLLRDKQNDSEIYRKKAYTNAIKTLSTLSKTIDIQTFERTKYPHIGDRIKQRILFYVDMSDPVEKEDIKIKNLTIKSIGKKESVNEFKKISGVGDVTAKKWYDNGYRRINDVPISEMNRTQLIYSKYYIDLEQRIPRDDILYFEMELMKHLLGTDIKFIICGSYRRGKLTSGDIDILVIDIPDKNVINCITSMPKFFKEQILSGPKKYRYIINIRGVNRQIDIELCKKEELPYAMLYFTGSGEFNKQCRSAAIKSKFHLNEKWMSYHGPPRNDLILERSEVCLNKQIMIVDKVICHSEKDILDKIGIKYLPPNERD